MSTSYFRQTSINKYVVCVGEDRYARWEPGNDGAFDLVNIVHATRFDSLKDLHAHQCVMRALPGLGRWPSYVEVHLFSTIDCNYRFVTEMYEKFIAQEDSFERELMALKQKYGRE